MNIMSKRQMLNILLEDLKIQHEKKDLLDKVIETRQIILTDFKTRIDIFDIENKESYIKEKIGSKPVAPKGLIKLAFPIYLAKKAKFEKDIVDYQNKYTLAEKAYYFDNQEKRTELQKTANQEKRDATTKIEEEFELANQAYQKVTTCIKDSTIVNEKYKSIEIVTALIDYLCDCRADNLKEAINLWHEEKQKRIEMEKAEAHRNEMLRLEQKRLEAAQEAAEYQRMVYYAAQEASELARESADEARRLVDDLNNSQ